MTGGLEAVRFSPRGRQVSLRTPAGGWSRAVQVAAPPAGAGGWYRCLGSGSPPSADLTWEACEGAKGIWVSSHATKRQGRKGNWFLSKLLNLPEQERQFPVSKYSVWSGSKGRVDGHLASNNLPFNQHLSAPGTGHTVPYVQTWWQPGGVVPTAQVRHCGDGTGAETRSERANWVPLSWTGRCAQGVSSASATQQTVHSVHPSWERKLLSAHNAAGAGTTCLNFGIAELRVRGHERSWQNRMSSLFLFFTRCQKLNA